MNSARERWYDFSCMMYLYSPMAVRGHLGCRVREWTSSYAKSVRVPERRPGQRGAVSYWRQYRRKKGYIEGWS